MNKVKIASVLITIASAFSIFTPSMASAATGACNGYFGVGTKVATASWGCVAAHTIAPGLSEVVSFDVNGDGKCVDLYWGKNGSNWTPQGRNCSGGFYDPGYIYGNLVGASDFRIVRSDGAFYTTVYGL